MPAPKRENPSEAILNAADELLATALRELDHHRRKSKGPTKIPTLALYVGASFVAYVRQLAGAQSMLAQLELADAAAADLEQPEDLDDGDSLEPVGRGLEDELEDALEAGGADAP